MSDGFVIGAMTDADRADVSAWLARASNDLAAAAKEPPRTVHETDSVAIVDAVFQPGPVPIPVRLTVYKDFGRVRIQPTPPETAPQAADRLDAWLAETLELRVVVS